MSLMFNGKMVGEYRTVNLEIINGVPTVVFFDYESVIKGSKTLESMNDVNVPASELGKIKSDEITKVYIRGLERYMSPWEVKTIAEDEKVNLLKGEKGVNRPLTPEERKETVKEAKILIEYIDYSDKS